MNMNKWMVFCKEFDLNVVLSHKDLISTYQSAAQFKSTMNLDEFLTAVAVIRERYVSKFNAGENFVRDVLNIEGEGEALV